jgi:hypothetical protein
MFADVSKGTFCVQFRVHIEDEAEHQQWGHGYWDRGPKRTRKGLKKRALEI